MNFVTIASLKWSALVACAALTLGCASGPPRELESQLVGTDTSIAQAEQSGAAQGALPELQIAKDKRARAQQAFDKKDWDLALQLARQAQADAIYASKKAQAEQAHKAALEVDRGTEKLRSETERNLAQEKAD
jgi:hypothetical protein